VWVDARGDVITSHGAGLPVAHLDGFGVTVVSNTLGALGRAYLSRSEQFWATARGGLVEQVSGGWNFHGVPEIAGEFRINSLRAMRSIPLLPLDRNRVLILLPDWLLEYDSGRGVSTVIRAAAATGLGRFHELEAGAEDGAWISGAGGLIHIPGPIRQVHPATEFEEHLIPAGLPLTELRRPFQNDAGAIVLAGENGVSGHRVVVRVQEGEWRFWAVPGHNLREAWAGPDGEFLGHTAGAVLRLEDERGELQARPILQVARIADLAVEPHGVAWLATAEGLVRIAPLPWRRAIRFDPEAGPVFAVTSDRLGRVLALTAGAVYRLEAGGWHAIAPGGGAHTEDVSVRRQGLCPFSNGRLLVSGGETNRLLSASGEPLAISADLAQAEPIGFLRDGRVLLTSDEEWSGELLVFDGVALSTYGRMPPEAQGLGAPSFALQARTGELWVGNEAGLLMRRGDVWTVIDEPEAGAADGALAGFELPDGRLLIGGVDAVREFDGRRWRVLRRGFDRVHGFQLARDGSLWIAAGSGLHRSREGSWFNLGEEEGLPSAAVFSVFEDGTSRLWAGTARGLSVLDPRADPDPPKAEITGADLPERAGDTRALFIVGGHDRWRFTPTGRLVFSWRMDNGPWSTWRPTGSVQFTNLTAGTHRFAVRAMDPSGNAQLRPAIREFAVSLPWFRDPRLVATSAAAVLLLVALAVQGAVSFWRLKRSYAEVERQVAERSAALEKANAELLHSHKMRALGTLAAGVAHDFNNLLSIIKGSAQLLESQLNDAARVQQRLQRIRTAVEQGAGLVRAMLGYSRGAAAPRKELDPTEAVQCALRLLDERVQQRIQFSPPTSTLPRVLAPPELLQQMVLNLVQNADEAMDRAGTVFVEVDHRRPPADCVLNPSPAPDYVILSVRDQGVGIPPENIARIFEPFFTTKGFSSRRGTGLGLSMVYEFAKELGAGLAVFSRVGVGSVFQVILPAALSLSRMEEEESTGDSARGSFHARRAG
jgi:signal transduction histidine kinase